MNPTDSSAQDVLQDLLAAEHAAVYVYGVLGGRVSALDPPLDAGLIAAAYAEHRRRRDEAHTLLRELGAEPVASEVAYRLQGPAVSLADLRREAQGVERRCAQAYGLAVAGTTGAQRRFAALALGDAAVRELSFGGKATTYPGADELTSR